MATKRSALPVWGNRIAFVLVGIFAIFAVTLLMLRLLGFSAYTVMSGSMEPLYPVGSLIYVKSVDYQDLQAGDVITFVADENNTVVTHRIKEVLIDNDSTRTVRYRTQGDANEVADAQLVHNKNVIGTPHFAIPLLGYIAFYIQHPPGVYIAIVGATLLVAWALLPNTLNSKRANTKNSERKNLMRGERRKNEW